MAAKLQVSHPAAFTEWTELNFQGLYLYHMYTGGGGPNDNQIQIIDGKGPNGIGAVSINNWDVKDGPGENANLVARAQGLHVYAGNWHNSFSLVFVNQRFNGSTLQVMGVSVIDGEWTIVGGTGQFARATGVISKKLHKTTGGGDIVEIAIHAYCPQLKPSA